MKNFRRLILMALASAVSMSFTIAQGTAAQASPAQKDNSVPIISQSAQECGYASALNQEELMNKREVQIASYELFRETRAFPKVNAMWVTYKNGEFGFIRWENAPEMNEASWDGPAPECAVAVVHTHPAGKAENLCYLDQKLAEGKQSSAINLPVYLLHRNLIIKAMPGCTKAVTVREHGWQKEFAPQRGEAIAEIRY